MQMRASIRPKYGLSPFEILFGRPVNTDIGPIKRQLPITDKDLMNNCNILLIYFKSDSNIFLFPVLQLYCNTSDTNNTHIHK